ncbi:MAG: DUF72 domain-containing protein [Bacteroidota bacterium]|jgi:uncharacterized protein YecE (DUF72 family)
MKDPERKIRVGMGGWQLEPFNGPLYPANPPKGFRKLEHYSRFFDVVEVNATFYTNALTPRNAHQWLQDVAGNPGFKFSVKLFKAFTHSMDATRGDVKSIHRLLEPMAAEEQLSGLVMQFPYSFVFNNQNRAYLAKLGKAFSEFRLFVEVRHNSWNVPEVHAFLQENNLHLVNVDLPKIKKHMPLTESAWGDAAYFRLMGRNAEMWDHASSGGPKKTASESGRYLYRYRKEELAELVEAVKRTALRMDETTVIFHNDPNGYSLLNGFQFRHLIQGDKRFDIPENLIAVFPELRAISSSEDASTPAAESGGE